MQAIKIIFFIAVISISLNNLASGSDTLSAQEIAQRRFDTNRGWVNMSAHVRMELTQGEATATRELEIKMFEQESSGERDLLRVLQPADLKGTVVLTHTHDTAPEEQWLYLPAIKRVKRIALETKGGAFLSSQFSFENLAPFQVQKYTYRRLADENYAGESCYVLESTPTEGSSVYRRLVNWIAQNDYRLLKTQFFDRDDHLEKTLFIDKYVMYRNKYWKPAQLKMVAENSGGTTVATWSDLTYDEHLDAREFDVTNLKRIGF